MKKRASEMLRIAVVLRDGPPLAVSVSTRTSDTTSAVTTVSTIAFLLENLNRGFASLGFLNFTVIIPPVLIAHARVVDLR